MPKEDTVPQAEKGLLADRAADDGLECGQAILHGGIAEAMTREERTEQPRSPCKARY